MQDYRGRQSKLTTGQWSITQSFLVRIWVFLFHPIQEGDLWPVEEQSRLLLVHRYVYIKHSAMFRIRWSHLVKKNVKRRYPCTRTVHVNPCKSNALCWNDREKPALEEVPPSRHFHGHTHRNATSSTMAEGNRCSHLPEKKFQSFLQQTCLARQAYAVEFVESKTSQEDNPHYTHPTVDVLLYLPLAANCAASFSARRSTRMSAH